MSTSVDILKDSRNVVAFPAGQAVFSAGDEGNVMYSVVEGEVEIVNGGQILEVVSEGGIVGELALIDDGPRSATAIARTDCLLTPIDQRRFSLIIDHNPHVAIQVMRVMANRLRAMNAR